jgi:hypothetical protein
MPFLSSIALINTLQVHCVYYGPTGGGKCVDIDYNTEYSTDDTTLFGSYNASICPKQEDFAVVGILTKFMGAG